MTTLEDMTMEVGGDTAHHDNCSTNVLAPAAVADARGHGREKMSVRSPGTRRRSPPAIGHERLGLSDRDFAAIPDRELLTHLLLPLIGDGNPDELVTRLLGAFGNVADIVTATAPRFREVTALGEDVLLPLRLLWELAARLAWREVIREPQLITSSALLTYWQVRLARARVDEVRVLYLDATGCLISDELHQSGTLGQVETYPREILRRALDLDAMKIAVGRRQLIGSARLSEEDRSCAKALEAAERALGIHLIDYVVVGRDSHAGYRRAR